MDQFKIGKFIAERRRQAGLTQIELAKLLSVTDRAVSKWEKGKAMPDSAIMLPLCEALAISVNDLLHGEVVLTDNFDKESEKLLLEMIKQKEENDKRLLSLEWVLGIMSLIILFMPIIIAAYLPMSDTLRIILTFSGFIPAIAGFAFALRLEQIAGYYECRHCKHKYIPEYSKVLCAPHMGRTRYMKCPLCGKKSWQKKVVSKE